MVYVDSNVFILAFLAEDKAAVASKSILTTVASNELTAFTSTLTWDEIVWSARKYLGIEDAFEQGKKFLEFPFLRLIDVNEFVIKNAQDLMQRYHLKPRDAIHAASALSRGIREIVSEDSDFDAIKELQRRSIRKF